MGVAAMSNNITTMHVDTELVLLFYNPAEVLLVKAAPFVSKQEMIILEELLDRVNDL